MVTEKQEPIKKEEITITTSEGKVLTEKEAQELLHELQHGTFFVPQIRG